MTGNGRHGIDIADKTHVIVSRNSTASNGGLGINLLAPADSGSDVTPNDPGDADTGPNDLLNFPVISGSTAQAVGGTACAHCTVELFLSDNDPSGYGEGAEFLADAETNAQGEFGVPICDKGLMSGAKVTATATDSLGDTSEFSLNYALPVGSGPCPSTPTPSPTATATPTPTATPTHTPGPTSTGGPTDTPEPTPTATPSGQVAQGDVDCDGDVDSVDALKDLRHVAGLPVQQTEPCADIGESLARIVPAGVLTLVGDVDCDRDVDSVDALKILRHVASLPAQQTEPCRDIGT